MFKSPATEHLLPHAVAHPPQANALLRTWDDLALAQQWQHLEVVDLPSCDCVVIRGTPKKKLHPAVVLPMAIAVPTSLAQLSAIFNAVGALFPPPPPPAPQPPPTVFLAIVEKDSSVVYYVLKGGIVSPLEVPE